MKKFDVLLAAAALLTSASASAGVYEGYSQNFTALSGTINDATTFKTTRQGTINWTVAGETDKYGLVSGNGNTTSATFFWGADKYDVANEAEANATGTTPSVDNYYLSVDFQIVGGNDVKTNSETGLYVQQACEFVISSSNAFSDAIFGKAWAYHSVTSEGYLAAGTDAGNDYGDNPNWIFALSMDPSTETNTDPRNNPVFFVNATETTVKLDATKWYTLTLMINKETRVVKYDIVETESSTSVLSGTRTIPAQQTFTNDGVEPVDINLLPSAIRFVKPRYLGQLSVDNLVVGKYTDKVTLPAPSLTIAPDGVYKEMRTYNPIFNSGETFNWKVDVEGAAVDGYKNQDQGTILDPSDADVNYIDFEKSCTIEFWVSKKVDGKEIESAHQTATIECGLIKLNTPTYAMTGCQTGYYKKYTITCNNEDLLCKPNATFKWEFKKAGTNEWVAKESGLSSGSSIEVEEAGSVRVIALNTDYESSDYLYIYNNQKYKEGNVIDFEHMTGDKITAIEGWEEIAPLESSETKGFQNWTARRKLAYTDATELEENATVGVFTSLKQWMYKGKETNVGIDTVTTWFPGLIPWYGVAQTYEILEHVGLTNTNTTPANLTLTLTGMEEGDIAAVRLITGYGAEYAGGTGNKADNQEEAANAQYHWFDGTNYYTYDADIIGKSTDLHGSVQFVQANGSFTLYRIEQAVASITFYVADGEPIDLTPVKEVQAADGINNNIVYDLAGRRVIGKPSKGLYIKNGKLFIQK